LGATCGWDGDAVCVAAFAVDDDRSSIWPSGCCDGDGGPAW
jgi:hypothetical protein